ncbi:MAG: tetratricopeptide repeat protein [Schwartzia succinivorans]|nr:tetratricopeptide repeat protein [Schwartzia succinivorans]
MAKKAQHDDDSVLKWIAIGGLSAILIGGAAFGLVATKFGSSPQQAQTTEARQNKKDDKKKSAETKKDDKQKVADAKFEESLKKGFEEFQSADRQNESPKKAVEEKNAPQETTQKTGEAEGTYKGKLKEIMKQGFYYVGKGDYNQAEKYFQEALSLAPDKATKAAVLSDSFIASVAAETTRKNLNTDFLMTYGNEALQYIDKKRARALFHFYMGFAQYRDKQYKKAKELLLNAAKEYSESNDIDENVANSWAATYVLLAQCENNLNSDIDYTEYYEKASEIATKNRLFDPPKEGAPLHLIAIMGNLINYKYVTAQFYGQGKQWYGIFETYGNYLNQHGLPFQAVIWNGQFL